LPQAAAEQLRLIESETQSRSPDTARDLRKLLWSSIDNRQSRDLDQVDTWKVCLTVMFA